jgi:hypothetical protein
LDSTPVFEVEATGETTGVCGCCGTQTQRVWGFVYRNSEPLAAYWMSWTTGHLKEFGANLDLVVGRWGDDASAADRVAVSLIHREQDGGRPALMVVDAEPSQFAELASVALARADVIGGPFAKEVFAVTDAIYLQDDRLFRSQ